MKNFNGKAIYQPAGKAAEYSKWACNFYVGCSNGCDYCYLKHGRGAAILGGNEPKLKKCFKNKDHAKIIFEKELKQNISELRERGLFLSFTTDPMLPKTAGLTSYAIGGCLAYSIPVQVLTKNVGRWVNDFIKVSREPISVNGVGSKMKNYISIGFTLTGHDELELGASTNQERIEAMKKLHDAGFKTFASIEPIIDFTASSDLIVRTSDFCDLYKIGLQSGRKYDNYLLNKFIEYTLKRTNKIYFKDSLLKQAGIDRKDLPDNCVGRDYHL